MPLNTGNVPLPDRPLVEQATAAPGELRDVARCDRAITGDWTTVVVAEPVGPLATCELVPDHEGPCQVQGQVVR